MNGKMAEGSALASAAGNTRLSRPEKTKAATVVTMGSEGWRQATAAMATPKSKNPKSRVG